ncbi:MAG: N-formylglutamate amidohydrolase [Methylocystis sp.]|nr:N-formylglutamate amidohydrolase [Methylocystis sp.]
MNSGSTEDWELSQIPAARVDRSDPEVGPPFELTEPDELSCPLVFSSPHSGNVYPTHFLQKTRLDAATLRRSEDAHVDALFLAATAIGAPLLRARLARAYLDLNREPYELDPRMFDDPLPDFANTRSLRVAAGLGTIPRVVADATEIYAGRLQVDEALRRIDTFYKPYHLMLRHLMERARRRFGVAVLIDCHSMPSGPARDKAPAPRREKRRADFIIGDRFGVSCSAAIVATIERRLREWGYHVQRNRPYAGGFITEHYGKPSAGWHAVQIEVARGLYMDEANLRRRDDFDAVAGRLGEMIRQLAQAAAGVGDQRAAAE